MKLFVTIFIIGLAFRSQAIELHYTYDENDRMVSVDEQESRAEYQYSDADNMTKYRVVVDSDMDGMPDEWEQHYFGGLTNATATTGSDPDGQSDYEEYIAGTDPQNSSSYLKATKAEPGKPGFKITWASETNRIYRLERTTNLMATSSFALLQEDIAGTPPLNVINDLTATNSRTYYYRIKTRER